MATVTCSAAACLCRPGRSSEAKASAEATAEAASGLCPLFRGSADMARNLWDNAIEFFRLERLLPA
jgi:hypothetical protein